MNDARRLRVAAAVIGVLLVTSACAVGPKYHTPAAPSSPAFRESLPEGWTEAQPSDGVPRGKWWEVYQDPGLNALEEQVSISNQNVLAAEAQFRAAKATVQTTRAGLFPVVSATPSASFAKGAVIDRGQQYIIPVDVSYQADVWGSIRRSVAADVAVAQASAAQLENARLLFQAELASDYFEIQGLDAEQRLLDATVQSDEQYLQLTQDRFRGGIATAGDVALAQTQLESARAQLTELGVARAQFEHAIAVLTGRTPWELSIPPFTAQGPPPVLSVGLPSTLLQRRPDIAAAERQVAAANEQIGVAKAAFYPALSFSGSAGTQAFAIAELLATPTRLWSVGVQAAETLFDGGRRRGEVRLSEADYDSTVANYRQTVLTGFQQVEDALAALRILAQEAEISQRAVAAAQQSLDIATIQYRGGLTTYLQVIISQTALLQNQRSTVDLLTRRLVASVSLIQALGGGWDVSQLPSGQDVRR